MRPFIVIAEDETSVAELLRYNLEALDYKTASATDGEEALLLIEERVPDLVILDWMLPKVSGIEICRRLRSRPQTANIPIMMLTAKTEEADRIRGLETGADDYITKPFSIHELMARVKAVLRRIRPALVEKLITVGDISINRGTYQVTRNGEPIELGPTEFRLLDYFAQHPGRVFS
ncbi:MAG: response regulator, partial [Henriciella sp.]